MRGTVPGGSVVGGGYGASVTSDKPDSVAPATLVWAVRLLYLQAFALAGLTAYLIYLDLTADAGSLGLAVALTVLAAIGVVFIVLVARAMSRRRIGSRGPAIVIQLMVIATGGFLLQTGPAWLGLGLMALAVAVGALVVVPPSTRALGVD
jgi:hypothetical protein